MIPLPAHLHGQSHAYILAHRSDTLPSGFWCGWETVDCSTTFDLMWQYPSGAQPTRYHISDSRIHLHYILAGRGELRLHNARYDVERGSAFLVVAPEKFAFGPHPQSPHASCESLTMVINSGSALIDIAQEILTKHDPVFPLHDDHPAISAMCSCIRLAAQGQLADEMSMCLAIFPIILALNAEVPTGERAQAYSLTNVVAYMNTHYHQPITPAALAASAALSERHFNRLFRQQTGYSPMDFLSRLRLQHALYQLSMLSDLPIATIAVRCGFKFPESFYRLNTRLLHESPSALRHLSLNEISLRIWPIPLDASIQALIRPSENQKR